MVYHIICWWATIFLRLYFRKTIVYGLEHIPEKGPLIVASNHPSAFMEASILGTVLRRPLHYLVRGDMFHPRFSWLFNWTNQIPIYRQKDGISNLRKNASSFDLTYRKLAEGEAVLIFPEAKTILEKKMRPIQRGTAHLAFGTLPFLKSDQKLMILPVGVNFTEPRLPGTDVVVRIGQPFETIEGRRDDRDAIEQFTNTLIDSMRPLIIQVDEQHEEINYDVLASVYLRFLYRNNHDASAHDHLIQVAAYVNSHDDAAEPISRIKAYRYSLQKNGIGEMIYFPHLVRANRILLLTFLAIKSIWWIAGGWIWRLARKIIFAKIKSPTFQSPTSLGIAMVLYPFISLLLWGISFIAGWPGWYVLIWLVVMCTGMFFRPPLILIWKILVLKGKTKSGLKTEISHFKELVQDIIKGI